MKKWIEKYKLESETATHRKYPYLANLKWHTRILELIAEIDEMQRLESDLAIMRRLLWLHHGCEGLYGDDGEMQCGKCLIDFKRDDIQTIEGRLTRTVEQIAKELSIIQR